MNENNKLAVFSSPEFGEVRTLEINGEPWFVGRDVATALGYENPSRDVNRHVEIEDRYVLSSQNYQNGSFEIPTRGLTIINESGLYSLIISSKLPNAKQFKRWVTSEVLPSIRKTGAYNITQTVSDRQLDVEMEKAKATLATEKRLQAELILRVAEKMNLSPEANQTLMAYTVEMMTGVKALPLPEVEKTYSATEAGEIIGVSAAKIGRVANANGIKTEDFGIFVLDKAKGSNKQVTTFRYNEKGLAKLRELFSE